jgi:TatD DNase family protein
MSKDLRYIDIHSHVNFPQFDADREEVIRRAQDLGIGMITVGTDIETSQAAVELANTHELMWATVGVHPMQSAKFKVQSTKLGSSISDNGLDLRSGSELGKNFCENNENEVVSKKIFDTLEKLARDPKVVAIGECGLDYFHSNTEDMVQQKELCEKHIILAIKVGKPLMLHVRNTKYAGSKSSTQEGSGSAQTDAVHRSQISEKLTSHNAYQDALDILAKYPGVRANFHFFAGTLSDLENIIERGYSVSFTGVVSFTSDYDQLVRSAPITQIMSETDCPFVAPAPYRGKRNEPAYVTEIVTHIARIRGEDEAVTAKQLVLNAQKFFNFP